MSNAQTGPQLNTEDEKKEFKPGLGDASSISNTKAIVDCKPSKENLKKNLKGLLEIINLRLQWSEPASDDGTALEYLNEPGSVAADEMDTDGLGHDQVDIDMSGRVNSPLETLNVIKSESDDNILLNEKDGSSSLPPKCLRRGLQMEVCVPTMDLLRHERHLKAEEDYKKLDKMINPNIKKKNDMMLGRDTLRERFQALGPSGLDLYPITLDKSLQDVMVSRVFMSAEYGGGSQAVCPTIGKKHIEKHGMNDFMFLHPEYQPVAPQVPGACGLFMSPGTSVGHEWPSVQRLFTRIESNVWQYMGMYRLMSSPSLTKREWADQDRKVQYTWGKEICKQHWGWDVRARVFARKRLGREPTKQELKDLSEEGSRKDSVTPDEIMTAFTKGEEVLGVWLMECVGYDNDFQLELCDKFPQWVAPPRKPRGSGNLSSAKKSKGAVRTSHKRKREDSPESEGDELNSEDKDLESDLKVTIRKKPKHSEYEDEKGLTYKPRGTRSRPVCIS